MNPFDLQDDRVIEASPALKQRTVEAGHGPRATWLASAVSGLLALGLLSIAAGPMSIQAKSWFQESLKLRSVNGFSTLMESVWIPAMICSATVLAAVIFGHAIAHGGWIRIGAWRRSRKPGLLTRCRGAIGGWILAVASLGGGVLMAAPWLPRLATIGDRSMADGLWIVGAFLGAVTLGALVVALVLGLLQMRLAIHAFDRTLRLTHGEARDEAQTSESSRSRHPRRRIRWRLA